MLGRWAALQKDLVSSLVCKPKRKNGLALLADDRGGPMKTRSAPLGVQWGAQIPPETPSADRVFMGGGATAEGRPDPEGGGRADIGGTAGGNHPRRLVHQPELLVLPFCILNG